MAKRYQPQKELERMTKKPKLDLSINKRCNSNNSLIQSNNSAAPMDAQVLWDDDDDMILQATQVAESQAGACNDFQFAPQLEASTSTQRFKLSPVVVPHHDILSEMFAEDDDDDFVILEAAACIETTKPQDIEIPKSKIEELDVIVHETEDDIDLEAVFRKPLQKIYSKSTAKEVHPSQSIARRQQASEQQIKFLMDRVDVLKKDNYRLTNELNETKTNILSKEGEASLLRDELRHMKQRTQTLQMEKIFTTEAAKNECYDKLAAISKQMAAKETELQIKSMECSVLKMRRVDETKRLELSVHKISVENDTEVFQIDHKNCNKPTLSTLKRFRSLNLTVPQSTTTLRYLDMCEMPFNPTHKNKESTNFRQLPASERDKGPLLQVELKTLQVVLNQLQLKSSRLLTISELDAYSTRILTSVDNVWSELRVYVQSLNVPKCIIYSYYYNDRWVPETQDLNATRCLSLLQSRKLYCGELAVSLRRYVASLSKVCQLLPLLAKQLLSHNQLMRIAGDAISKVGYTSETYEHCGLLEAFADLLSVMLTSDQLEPHHAELLVNCLLKQLVFSRPNSLLFKKLSYCLLLCMKSAAASFLCSKSYGNAFIFDQAKSIYRFTQESCILQVYVGLLEIAFPTNASLSLDRFKLLSVICANHVRFVYYCFAQPLEFIHDRLPNSDAEDDEEDHLIYTIESSTSITDISKMEADGIAKCQCYTKLCLSVVTLLFQLLRQWSDQYKKDQGETARISMISKLSVQLLHIIICDNAIFHNAGETTKHYLTLICKWWSANALLLELNEFHLNFLHKLQNSQVLSKSMGDEKNTNMVGNLKDWQNFTNEKDNVASLLKSTDQSNYNSRYLDLTSNVETFFDGFQGYAFNF